MNLNERSKNNLRLLLLSIALCMIVLLASPAIRSQLVNIKAGKAFDGKQAYQDVQYQVSLGPRIPESSAHKQAVAWMTTQLRQAGWAVEIQETTRMGHPVQNVIGKWGQGQPWVVLGAHYDSRLMADQDPNLDYRTTPVPGANDGASGVALLLEIARVLPVLHKQHSWSSQVWIVLFDAEDNGEIYSWDWTLGAQAFVDSLKEHPQVAIIVDMIGDADLNIYRERNSNPLLMDAIWGTAHDLGYSDYFIQQPKYRMTDDHTPFLQAGIPAVDIIDFDYPYWHTVSDLPDKVSAHSLQVVGDTLLAWLVKPASQ